MIRRMAVVRIFACLLAAFAPNCAAAPMPATIGNDRLVLDSPPGFSDSLQLASPRLQELAESLTSASDRVLLFALADADLRAFMQGDPPAFRRYMVISTPVRFERERVDTTLFASTVTDTMRQMGKPVPPDDYIKHLDAQPTGSPSLLAELRREPETVSLLQGTRLLVPATKFWENDKSRYVLSSQTMLLLRGKVLSLVIISNLEGRPDYDWMLQTTERWIEELGRLNRR